MEVLFKQEVKQIEQSNLNDDWIDVTFTIKKENLDNFITNGFVTIKYVN